MKFKDLDLNEFSVNMGEYTVSALDTRPRSKPHLRARGILNELFPVSSILEEVRISLKGWDKALIDFFIPDYYLVIEVHGKQHYEFNPFFHKTRLDFMKQQRRDRQLIEWCELNELTYIELPDSEKEDAWINRILQK